MIESMLWRFEIWKHEHLINQTFLEFEVESSALVTNSQLQVCRGENKSLCLSNPTGSNHTITSCELFDFGVGTFEEVASGEIKVR